MHIITDQYTQSTRIRNRRLITDDTDHSHRMRILNARREVRRKPTVICIIDTVHVYIVLRFIRPMKGQL